MKRYRFVEHSFLPEVILRDPVVLELVRKMQPDDIVSALVKDLGLSKDDARLAAGSLVRHAFPSMSMPYHSTKDDSNPDKDLDKLSKVRQRKEKGQVEGFGMGAPNSPIPTYLFPSEEEEDDEWPYDAATKGVMNSPLAGGPRMTT